MAVRCRRAADDLAGKKRAMDSTNTHGSVSPLGRWKRRFQRFRSIRIFRWLPAGSRRSSKRSEFASSRSGFRHDLDNSSACVRRAARSVPAACHPEIHDGSGLPTQQLSLVRRVRTPPMTRLRWPYRSGIRLGPPALQAAFLSASCANWSIPMDR